MPNLFKMKVKSYVISHLINLDLAGTTAKYCAQSWQHPVSSC